MANDLIHIDNAETGVNETREMTKAEQAVLDADRQAAKVEQEAKVLEAATQAAAKAALLKRLGLTATEAELLLS